MQPALFDLHTHTTCSDGALSPRQLAERAVARGVSVLAVTDHDTVAAWPALRAVSLPNLQIVPGIELSSRWGSLEVHVVGLNINVEAPELLAGIAAQGRAREVRAERIAHRLARRRIPDPLAGAQRHAGEAVIGRPHFAAHLVDCGAVPDARAAFRRFLGNGKLADVRTEWPTLDVVTGWIRAAQGQSVLAHPLKYKITATKRQELLRAFRQAGGDAVEVISGHQQPHQTQQVAALCERFSLLASVGSDFHSPDHSWTDVGRGLTLPRRLTPVWSRW